MAAQSTVGFNAADGRQTRIERRVTVLLRPASSVLLVLSAIACGWANANEPFVLHPDLPGRSPRQRHAQREQQLHTPCLHDCAGVWRQGRPPVQIRPIRAAPRVRPRSAPHAMFITVARVLATGRPRRPGSLSPSPPTDLFARRNRQCYRCLRPWRLTRQAA